MKHRNSAELLACWDAARGGADAPARTAMEPASFPRILPFVFLLDLTGDAPSFRLAGTALCSVHGRELRGEAFSALWAGTDRAQVETAVTRCCSDRIAAVILSAASNGRTEIPFETLVLPLLHAGDSRQVAIGIQTPLKSHWSLGAHPAGQHVITGMEILAKGPASNGAISCGAVRREPPVIDFSRRGRVPPGTGRQVGHLTVIEGGSRGG